MMKKYTKLLKFISFALMLSFIFSIVGGCAQGGQPSATVAPSKSEAPKLNGEIVIGASVCVTGEAAPYGDRSRKGLDQALKEINDSGGILGKKVIIDVQDDQALSEPTIAVAQKFISDRNRITCVIGPTFTGTVMAIDKIVADAKMVFFAMGSGAILTKLNNPYIFIGRPNDSTACKIAGKFLIDELKLKKIAIMNNNDDFGSGSAVALVDYFKSRGVEYIVEGHNSGDREFSGTILKLKDAGCDGLCIWGHQSEIPIIARQMNELGWKPKVMGSGTVSQQEFQVLCAPGEIEGWYSAAESAADDPDPVLQKIEKTSQEVYGISISTGYILHYSGLWMLKNAIERAGSTDTEAIRKAMKETKNYGEHGLVYTCNTTNNFMVLTSVITQVIRDGDKTKNKTVSKVTVDPS